jgi:hypothetical protein
VALIGVSGVVLKPAFRGVAIFLWPLVLLGIDLHIKK